MGMLRTITSIRLGGPNPFPLFGDGFVLNQVKL